MLHGQAQGQLELRLQVPPGFTVYRDQLVVRVVETGDLVVGAPDIPPGVHKHDPAYDVQVREQYDTDIVVRIPVRSTPTTARGLESLQVLVRHQGCFQGHCFRPVEKVMRVYVPVRPELADGTPVPEEEVRDVEPQDSDPLEPPQMRSGPTETIPAPRFVVFVHGALGAW